MFQSAHRLEKISQYLSPHLQDQGGSSKSGRDVHPVLIAIPFIAITVLFLGQEQLLWYMARLGALKAGEEQKQKYAKSGCSRGGVRAMP